MFCFRAGKAGKKVHGEARTASTQRLYSTSYAGQGQSRSSVVDGKGGAKVVCGEVEEDVSDIDPESGTGTSTPVATGERGKSLLLGSD